jgi:regulator of replication initiation timing
MAKQGIWCSRELWSQIQSQLAAKLEESNALALEVARLRARATQAYEQATVESALLEQKNERQCRAHEQEVEVYRDP